jgi:hypothetical protein
MTTRSTSVQRAAKLPAPVPGTVVTVPLDLWPAYQEIHQLAAMEPAEVSKTEERTGTRKEPGVVWVKQVEQASARGEQ